MGGPVHGVEVLEVGGVPIPLAAAYDVVQTYKPITADFVHRMNNGAAVKHSHFRKLETTIQGKGAIPAGLSELEYSAALVIRCIASRGTNSKIRRMALPPWRRTDEFYQPAGFCLIRDVWHQSVLETVAGEPHTFDVVHITGATMYRIEYFPELIAFAQPPEDNVNQYQKDYGWTLKAEQI